MKDKADALWVQTQTRINIREHYESLKQTAEQWAEHIIKLIVIFLMHTLIIPPLLLWIPYSAARSVIGGLCRYRFDSRNS